MRFGDGTGAYEIQTLPGSPQVAVSVRSFVLPKLRGKGHGTRLHRERLAKIKELGYDYTLCTVDLTNAPQLAIMKAFGWSQLATFISSASGHTVGIFGKHIDHTKG